jgi:hypothetical protein
VKWVCIRTEKLSSPFSSQFSVGLASDSLWSICLDDLNCSQGDVVTCRRFPCSVVISPLTRSKTMGVCVFVNAV